MKFIAITGPQQSGKSTVARQLVDHHGFVSLEFSEPIERMIRALITPVIGVPLADLYINNPEYKEQPLPKFGVSYRDMGRRLGSEWGRHLSPKMWLTYLDVVFDDAVQYDPTGIVMPGLRLPVEAEWVRQRGGSVWMVTKPGSDAPTSTHDTESSFSSLEWDYSIYNHGSPGDLKLMVNTIINSPDSIKEFYPNILTRPKNLKSHHDDINHKGVLPG